jgi:hypothetical protein
VIDVEEQEGNKFESMIKSFRHFMNSNFAQKKQKKKNQNNKVWKEDGDPYNFKLGHKHQNPPGDRSW